MFHKIFILLVCLSTTCTVAEEYSLEDRFIQNSYDVVISLGRQCHVTDQLISNNIRSQAFPFDWVLTPFASIYQFITHEGKHFLDIDKLRYVQGKQYVGELQNYIEDTVYHIQLLHDFKLQDDFLKDYDQVKAKYDRRITRFFDTLQSHKRILFIRLGITQDEAIRLDYLLHDKYPQLSYTLIAIDYSEEMKIDWRLERVKNFYIEQSKDPRYWDNPDTWSEILNQFQIKNTEAIE